MKINYGQIALLTLAILLPAIILLSTMASEAPAEAVWQTETKPVHEVAVITISEQPTLLRQLLGTVFAPQTQTLSSQVAGVVVSQSMEMGQQIAKGDVVVQLDDREALANLALAKAEMDNAKIRVKQKRLIFNRIEETFGRKLASRAAFDEADLDYQQTQSELLAHEAKVQLAKLNIEKHRIVAPFSGVLIFQSPVVGKQLLPGENVVEMLNNNRLRIKVAFSQQELIQLQKSLAFLVLPKEKLFSLVMLRASPATRISSGLIEAEFLLPEHTELNLNQERLTTSRPAIFNGNGFYPGQTISLQLNENRMSVPEQAILEDYQGQYVLAVADGKVVRVAIHDLTVGQKIVVLGSNNLRVGDNVSIINVGETPARDSLIGKVL